MGPPLSFAGLLIGCPIASHFDDVRRLIGPPLNPADPLTGGPSDDTRQGTGRRAQGPTSANVLRKKALLEGEGVKFSGLRVDAASLMAPNALTE